MLLVTKAIDLLWKPELKSFLIPRQTVGRVWFQLCILGYHPSYLINKKRDENNTSFINTVPKTQAEAGRTKGLNIYIFKISTWDTFLI